MSDLIVIVDDNMDILFNLKIMLETRGYDVLSASSGKEGLKLLSSIEKLPEVIISDIMMPNMNGYEFFASTSSHPEWNHIPFLFLTAKSTPEDIRLGKMLGADDYITKPFIEEDLIASISGKISRKRQTSLIDNELQQLLRLSKEEIQQPIIIKNKAPFCLMVVFWDDIVGPVLKNSHPSEKDCHFSISTIGKQLFHSATSIYGQNNITKAEGILLNIENIQKNGYIFFDAFPKKDERFGEKQFMLSVISPSISYFDSLKIKEVLREISGNIKRKKDWKIKEYWQKIFEILSTGSFLMHS